MKTKLVIAGLVGVIIVLAASMVLGRGTAKEYTGQKWEYAMAVLFTGDEKRAGFAFTNDEDERVALQDEIDALDKDKLGSLPILQIMGDDGWEMMTQTANGDPAYIQFMFKRPAE